MTPGEAYQGNIFLWVPGSRQPSELAPWQRGGTRSPAGCDYWFGSAAAAFYAADVLRKHKLPYDLQMTPSGRKPWLRGRTSMRVCFSNA